MKQIIAISTHKTTARYLDDLMKSINTKYPILIHENNKINEFEIGALREAYESGYDEIFLMPDTCLIKDNSIFDICFKSEKSVSIGSNYQCLIGKYKSKIIDIIGIPYVRNKIDAVMSELQWNHQYIVREPLFWNMNYNLNESDNIIEKYDKRVMILENQYLIKYKSHWNLEMCYGI